MNRRTFIKGTMASAAAVAAGTSLYAYGIERQSLEKTSISLSIGLNKPLRIAALGDIHFDPLYEEIYLNHVANCITDSQPDLVVYTGDFISHSVSRIKDLVDLLSRSGSRLGSFATLGNHDHWSGAGIITTALESKGIRVLRNQSFALPDQDNFFLTGLDSYWAGTPNLGVFSQAPKNSHHILLLHEPDPFAELNDPRIKLQISGHTHGGQIRLPFVGPLRLPVWGRNYDEGLFTQNGRFLYVNRGIGTMMPHLRFGCRPELTIFELT